MPRKTLKQRRENNPTDDKENRVRSVIDNLIGTEDADDIMTELLDVLKDDTTDRPMVGSYYTFVYMAKTSGIAYDTNPLVAVTEVYQWGFRGINYHWGDIRQYTWQEIVGPLYKVYSEELKDLKALPFKNIKKR